MVDSRKMIKTMRQKLDAMTNDEKIAFLEKMGFVLVDKPDKKVKPKGRVVRVRRSSVKVRKNED